MRSHEQPYSQVVGFGSVSVLRDEYQGVLNVTRNKSFKFAGACEVFSTESSNVLRSDTTGRF